MLASTQISILFSVLSSTMNACFIVICCILASTSVIISRVFLISFCLYVSSVGIKYLGIVEAALLYGIIICDNSLYFTTSKIYVF